jgi:hypothetical protein
MPSDSSTGAAAYTAQTVATWSANCRGSAGADVNQSRLRCGRSGASLEKAPHRAGRNGGNDGPFDRFVGQFLRRPVADRAVATGGWFTGQRDDLDHLLGGEAGRRPGARGIAERIGHQAGQEAIVVASRDGRFQPGRLCQPPRPPGPHRAAIEIDPASDLLVVAAAGGSENNLKATDQTLGTGVAACQVFHHAAETIAEDDGRGRRATPRVGSWDGDGRSDRPPQHTRNRPTTSANVY